jgi:uncharacterized protein (DUF885 family)
MRFPLLALALAACSGAMAVESDDDARFHRLADEFVATHFAWRPLAGVALGWHQYDGQFVVPDAAALAEEKQRLQRFETAFGEMSGNGLSPDARRDWQLLRSSIAGERWALHGQSAYSRNPMTYAGGLEVSVYLKRSFKPLPERVADITAILRQAPSLLEAARRNLETVLPKPFVETAIEVAGGTADFLEKDVATAAATVTDADVRSAFDSAKATAVTALRAYADWLKKEKLPIADGSFALGREHFREMLAADLIDLAPEQILELGMRELHAEQERFTAAAAIIDPKLTLREAAAIIQREHPTAEGLIPDTRKNLEAIRQFVVKRRLVTIPSEVRARVEETLPPFRATSFASMDTPGPFETTATEAYYYVTPVEPHWTPQQAAEWLGAFNYYAIDVTGIHEAYPGHYVQFLALNASAASAIAKAFGNYAFIEGWAHYCEQMVLDEGYGQPADPATASREDVVRGAKMRLAQSSDALLRLCRLCCSIRLHTQGMSVDEAARFFAENCYYGEKPARSEAVRGTFDPGYLYYTLGKLMLLKLRRDWQAQEGGAFTLQRFHDECLRHGMPPIRLLREIMLKDPALWPAVLPLDSGRRD